VESNKAPQFEVWNNRAFINEKRTSTLLTGYYTCQRIMESGSEAEPLSGDHNLMLNLPFPNQTSVQESLLCLSNRIVRDQACDEPSMPLV
jgi:hypothetical protein